MGSGLVAVLLKKRSAFGQKTSPIPNMPKTSDSVRAKSRTTIKDASVRDADITTPPERTIRGLVAGYNGRGREFVEALARSLFRSMSGGTKAEEGELERLTRREKQLQSEATRIEEAISREPMFEPGEEVKPMRAGDVRQIAILLVLLALCQTGAMTLFANLVLESGLFLAVETVRDAMWLCLSIPLASVVLKFADHRMSEGRAASYQAILVEVALASLLVWVASAAWVLMPIDAGGSLMISDLESDGSAWRRALYSSSQLIFEITASAVIFNWIIKRLESYRPARKNQKLVVLERELAVTMKELKAVASEKAKWADLVDRKMAKEDATVKAADAERSIVEYVMRGGSAMKILAVSLCIGSMVTSDQAKAAEYVIMLGSVTETEAAEINNALSDLYRDLLPGDSMAFYDGAGGYVSGFTFPESRVYANERVKARFQEGRQALAEADREFTRNFGGAQSLDLPRLARTLGEISPGREQVVLLVGAAQMSGQGTFSMVPGNLRPSDSHILNSPEASKYGTKGVDWLRGRRVHWLTSDHWDDEAIRDTTCRVWFHYVKELGGELVTFSDSAGLVFPRVTNPTAGAAWNWSPLDSKEPLLMLRIQPRKAVVEFAESSQSTSPARPVLPTQRGRIRVGVQWNAPCDVDLWILRKGKWCSFAFPQPEAGVRHYKDVLSGSNGLEMIEYEVASLDELAECYVNLWSGSGPVHGQIILTIGDARYRGDFTIRAASGNRGTDIENRAGSPFWSRIDLAGLVPKVATRPHHSGGSNQ